MALTSDCIPHSNTQGIYVSLPELLLLKSQTKFSYPLINLMANQQQPGQMNTHRRGRGLMFEELRHYQPGDDIRLLDWKTTKRTGQPHIRVFTEEREKPTYIVLDQRSSLFFGSQRQMKSVLAAELFALVAWQTLKAGDRVGAFLCSESAGLYKPQRSERNLLSVLKKVEQLNHALSATNSVNGDSLNDAVNKLGRLACGAEDIWIISDLEGLSGLRSDYLNPLLQKNNLRMLMVTDPLEESMPACHRWSFSQAGQFIELNTHSRELRNKYAEQFLSGKQRIQSLILGPNTSFLELTTALTLREQVFTGMTPSERRFRS